MPISKTRQKLIEVARSLFAHQGLEATTMNDIAVKSGRGRRTLYTYFRNKEEVYYAVIEGELQRLSEKMDEAMQLPGLPEVRVRNVIHTHLDAIRETVTRNGTLRAEFFRNIWMVERVRRRFDAHEHELMRKLIQAGVDSGRFVVENVGLMADIICGAVKGLEVPYIYDRLGEGLSDEEAFQAVEALLHRALNIHEITERQIKETE